MKLRQNLLKLVMTLLMGTLLISCGNQASTASTSNDGENKKYIIATDLIYPPFSIKDDNGDYIGIDVEILKAVAEIEGFDYELKPMDFGGIIPALESGQLDGAIAGATITEERKKVVDFSDSYYEKGLVAVVNIDDDSIKTADDLVGKVMAVKNGTAGAAYVDENLSGKVDVRVYEDTVSMFTAVENNQADAAFEDAPVIEYLIKTTPNSKLKIGTDKLTTGDYGFMVKKGSNAELLEMFNSGLRKIKENGTYDEILNKYR